MGENAKEEIGKKSEQKQSKNKGGKELCEISQPKRISLRKRPFVAKSVRNTFESSAKVFVATNPRMAHECHSTAQEPPFRSCEVVCEPLRRKKSPISTAISPFCRVFRNCETDFWHTSAIPQYSDFNFAAAKWAAKVIFSCETPNFAVKAVFFYETDSWQLVSQLIRVQLVLLDWGSNQQNL